MNPIIRLPRAKSFFLASASALALTIAAPHAYAGPLSEHVVSGGATGPAPNPTSPIPGLPAAVSTQAQAQAAQAQTTANLATAAARLQAALSAQANARNTALAANSSVPDGLATGGLQVDPRATNNTNPNYNPLYWIGADQPTQTANAGQTTVTIDQHQAQAILNWQTFNVGKKTTVNFVQKDSTGTDQTSWVALNKVNDPAALPSQILGQINAPGSVYILNRNGVIFGGTAQVNVHSLVAAAADYNSTALDNSPANFAAAFTANGLYSPEVTVTNGGGDHPGYDYSPAFVNAGGDVTVQSGAQINTAAPASVTAGGGFVLLMGANVRNDGVIETPNGQAALAAGDNFYIRPGYSSGDSTGSIADNNTSSTTRGNEIAYSINPGSASGSATNTGLLQATTGDVTIVGRTVAQNGVAFATTSVNQRGTVHLLTSQGDPTASVSLGGNGLTTVQPDISDTATALDSQRAALIAASGSPNASDAYRFEPLGGNDGYLRFTQFDDLSLLSDRKDESRIEVTTGGLAEFKGGSLTMAQGGQIAVSAVARVLVGTGAGLDVSGSLNVLLPASANILTVNIQGNELRDAPVDRDTGDLFNNDIYVDERYLTYVPAGTDGYATDRYYTGGGLAEVSGWLANQGHTIGEWTAAGGTVTLQSGLGTVNSGLFTQVTQLADATPISASMLSGDVIVQPGALINLSGGSIDYAGGHVQTTALMSSGGVIYNINNAPADLTYTGLADSFQVDHTRWVTTDSYGTGLAGDIGSYDPAYVVGKDAGTLILQSPTVVFEGSITDGVVLGAQQNAARPAGVTDSYLLPQSTVPVAGMLNVGSLLYINSATDMLFGRAIPAIASGVSGLSALPADRVGTAWFDAAALDSFDLGGLEAQTYGNLSIAAALTLAPGGKFTLEGKTVDIAADLTARSGSVNVTALPNTQLADALIPVPGAVDITLEPGITIDTRGLFTNEMLDPADGAGQAYINGGAVSLMSNDGITLSAGSLIDASAGGYVSPKGVATIGNGGNINLLADNLESLIVLPLALQNPTAVLTLDGTVRSTGAKGGVLTLQFPEDLIIGDNVTLNGNVLPAGMEAPGNLQLADAITVPAGQPLPLPYGYPQTTTQYVLPGAALRAPFSIPVGLTIAADWVNPTSAFYAELNGVTTFYYNGDTIPAGSVVTNGYGESLPAGYVVPGNVFPQGLPVSSSTSTIPVAPGSTYTSDVTFIAGTVVPTGSVFSSDVKVMPVTVLPTSFFQQGFSNYVITNFGNVTVVPGAKVDVREPVFQATGATVTALTGSDPANAFTTTLAPTYLVNPTSGAITQRPGASLTLQTSSKVGQYTDTVSYSGSYTPGTVLIDNLPGNTTLVLQADFTLGDFPQYENYGVYAQLPGGQGRYFQNGDTIPAGSVVKTSQYYTFAAGDILPVSVFGAAPIPTGRSDEITARQQTLTVGNGAAITADPQQSITLSSPGQVTVDGSLTAHGGAISILNTIYTDVDPAASTISDKDGFNPTLTGLSIWLGSDALLDVSAQAFTGVTGLGKPVGLAPNGGSILIGNQGTSLYPNFGPASTSAFLVIRPGAVLDADGASASVDLYPTQRDSSATLLNGDGGTISLTSYSGIFNDGTWSARAGGAGASGGTLNLTIATPVYYTDMQVNPNPNVAFVLQAPRYLEIGQDTVQSLPDTVSPGVPDPLLAIGQAKVSVQQIAEGGFGNVNLTGGNGLNFDGDVNLAVSQSLTLTTLLDGGLSDTTDNAHVTLQAPYVRLAGNILGQGPGEYQWSPPGELGAGTGASIAILAQDKSGAPGSGLMELRDSVFFDNSFENVALTSQGDLRFADSQTVTVGLQPNNYDQYDPAGPNTSNLSLTAQRIYALPQSQVNLNVVGDLSIHGIGAPQDQAIPDTFFTSLRFSASSIEQDGALFAPGGNISFNGFAVDLMPNSLTSVSTAGLLLPYGGSVDGLTYLINNTAVTAVVPSVGIGGGSVYGTTIAKFKVDPGAVIDVSGGGEFQGKSFISGRGGSVDALTSPLLTFAGSAYNSHASNQVFAIVPGWSQPYAPTGGLTLDGSADPAPQTGAQITIPAGVPGLPAGRYTLLPSEYALLPGGFRVELQGTAKMPITSPALLPDGSYLLDGVQSIANTAVTASVPTQIQIASGTVFRTYSQYNTATLSQVQAAAAKQLAADTIASGYAYALPYKLADAGDFTLGLSGPGDFTYAGTTLFGTGPQGLPGQVTVYAGLPLEITSDAGPQQDVTKTAIIPASTLSAIGAPILTLDANGSSYGGVGMTVDSGSVLTGTTIEAFAIASPLTIQSGAKILATQQITLAAPDSNVSCQSNCAANPRGGSLTLMDGATVISQGGLVLEGTNLTLDPGSVFGGTSLSLGSDVINIGPAAALADAADALPPGLALTQERFNTLLSGNTAAGIPALQQLTLDATGSVNLVGTVNMDGTAGQGSGLQFLELDTPAIFGLGSASDSASITTGTFIWNGAFTSTYNNIPAPGIKDDAPGTGSGSLTINAKDIIIGSATPGIGFYPVGYQTYGAAQTGPVVNPQSGIPLQATPAVRVTTGFSSVNLIATDSITSNSHGSVSVLQRDGSAASLSLTTPLLTGTPGSVVSYSASGALTVAPPSGAAANPAVSNSLGAEIDLSGQSITVDSIIAANSGRVTLNAVDNIDLGATSRIDLSGMASVYFDVVDYSWGGDLALLSANGHVVQAPGSIINVSALNNNGGTLTVQAVGSGGEVALNGSLLGASTLTSGVSGSYLGGSATIDAQTLNNDAFTLNADFTALNASLDAGGFYGARLFDLKQGNLDIDNLKASDIEVSLDGGSLTVNGLLDASGVKPGTIRLSAANDLTLASSAVLDAHGTVLQLDSYGAPIDAENSAAVELSAVNGTLTLAPHATIDVSSPEATPEGDIELNVGRTGETSGDARINASGPLDIRGAQTIAVNAFWTYSPTDANGTIVQDNGDTTPISGTTGFAGLDQIDSRNTSFINAALGNGDVLGRLGGLAAYSDAFHLRPGVEIVSATSLGDLTTSGDLDFSGFRYGPHADRDPLSATYGAGEPGVLILRAGGNLNINGSINDGFAPPPSSPDGVLIPGAPILESNVPLPSAVTFTSLPVPNGASGHASRSGRYFYFDGTLPTVVAGEVDDPYFGKTYTVGDTIWYFGVGTTFQAGTKLSFPGVADGATLLNSPATQQQAPIWALSPLLPQGDLSWSMRLVSGADRLAADTRLLQPKSTLDATGRPAYVTPIFHNVITFETDVAIPETITFFDVPTPNAAIGESVRGGATFVMPGYCGYYCSAATVIAGEVKFNNNGQTFGPNAPHQMLSSFTPFGNGVTFETGTILDIAGVPSGTPFLTGKFDSGGDTVAAIPTKGNIILNDPHAGITVYDNYFNAFTAQVYSVVRTGTGNLDLLAGEDYTEKTPFSIYTAGTQSATVGVNVPNPVIPLGQAKTYVTLGVAAPTTFTLSKLPTADASLGEQIRGRYFYFAGYFDGNQDEEPVVTAGQVVDGGREYDVGDHIPWLRAGAVFAKGTVLSLTGVDAGTVLLGTPENTALTGAPPTVNQFNLPEGLAQLVAYSGDGSATVLGNGFPDYTAAIAGYQAYYPEHGGNLRLVTQGNITETPLTDDKSDGATPFDLPLPDAVGNWLWRQGGNTTDQATAWWINFGTYVNPTGAGPALTGFQGIGTLGGGNLTLLAGGGINNLDAAVASTGRVTAVDMAGSVVTGGTLVQTGGGNLTIRAGGDVSGAMVDVRGDVSLQASTIGSTNSYTGDIYGDTLRQPDAQGGLPFYFGLQMNGGWRMPEGLAVVQGDSGAILQARGNVFINGEADAGMVPNGVFYNNASAVSGPNAGQAGLSQAWFSLYTANTSLTMDSAGGDVVPLFGGTAASDVNITSAGLQIGGNGYGVQIYMAPPTMKVVAETGNIMLEGNPDGGSYGGSDYLFEAMPSPTGSIEYLAGNNIQGVGLVNGALDFSLSTPSGYGTNESPTEMIGISGANAGPNDLVNPFKSASMFVNGTSVNVFSPFLFEVDQPTTALHADDPDPIRLYAANGNIESIGVDDMAKSADIRAGQNITYLVGQVANVKPTDISIISAGGTILYPDVAIGGPGQLAVEAGSDVFMGVPPDPAVLTPGFITPHTSAFTSNGLYYGQNGSVSGGAGISVIAGLGADGPDYSAFKALYLDPNNQADPTFPLDFPQNQGKVVQTYQNQLYAWLQATYAYTGSEAGEMAFFNGLSTQQQAVFLQQAFFNELDQADVEFNDPSSKLFKSYVRGRTAIATLFPDSGTEGDAGSVTLLGGSGIRTEFGGDIDILTPNGATTIGIEGPNPPSTAGVITQGLGNVDIYSLGSVELGQSRVFTTFGGDITIWSATGDINAGRGAKTTVVYSPPLFVYDPIGNITLSPTVPSQGAGIATLAPIPGVPPGNVYLVAPLGTIDAGEAGIRVSGNAFLAALHIANAANIRVQGQVYGLPPKPITNLAFTAASVASTEAASIVKTLATQHPSTISVEVTGFGGDFSQPDVCSSGTAPPCAPDGR